MATRIYNALSSVLGGRVTSSEDAVATNVPQSKPLDGQVKNSAGGYSWQVDDIMRLRRFLILGVEGGTFYAKPQQLGLENATAIMRLLGAGRGCEVVDEIVDVSVNGRAAKQQPTLFALAMCARLGDVDTRRAAFDKLSTVCRIPTHLFMFIGFSESMGGGSGWGRLPRAIQAWYNDKKPEKLAYTCTKYRNREGWTHTDVLRLTHAKPSSAEHNLVFRYLTKGWAAVDPEGDGSDIVTECKDLRALELLRNVEAAKTADEDEMLRLIAIAGLAREHIPTPLLNSVKIWETLLENMPMTAMMRNLAKMTNIGLIKDLSSAANIVAEG